MTRPEFPTTGQCDHDEHLDCTGIYDAVSGPSKPCGCGCHDVPGGVHEARKAFALCGVDAHDVRFRLPHPGYTVPRVGGGTLVIDSERAADGDVTGWTWTAYDDEGDDVFTDGTEGPLREAAARLLSAVGSTGPLRLLYGDDAGPSRPWSTFGAMAEAEAAERAADGDADGDAAGES